MIEKISSEVDLLARHLTVMNIVSRQGPIGIMKLTECLHESQHRIRYSLRVLEQSGYIQATSSGAVATPKAISLLENLDADLGGLIEKLQQLRNNK